MSFKRKYFQKLADDYHSWQLLHCVIVKRLSIQLWASKLNEHPNKFIDDKKYRMNNKFNLTKEIGTSFFQDFSNMIHFQQILTMGNRMKIRK